MKVKKAKKVKAVIKKAKAVTKKVKTVIKKPAKKIKAPVTTSEVKSKIMVCIVTGIERRVSKAGIAKGMKKFASLAAFSDHYVSNEAKRLLRQRVSPEEVQKQLRPKNLKPFSIDHQILARLKLLKKPRKGKVSIEDAHILVKKWVPAERKTYSSVQAYVVDNTQNGNCIAPQLYLNSDRVCDDCKYTEWCLSTSKQFSKRYKR